MNALQCTALVLGTVLGSGLMWSVMASADDRGQREHVSYRVMRLQQSLDSVRLELGRATDIPAARRGAVMSKLEDAANALVEVQGELTSSQGQEATP